MDAVADLFLCAESLLHYRAYEGGDSVKREVYTCDVCGAEILFESAASFSAVSSGNTNVNFGIDFYSKHICGKCLKAFCEAYESRPNIDGEDA